MESGALRYAGIALLKTLKVFRYIFRIASRAEGKRLKLGSIYHTPIFATPSALVLAALLYFFFGPAGVLIGAVSLMLHEFAHVLEGRKHSIPTSHVLISAAGAAASMEMNEENHFLLQPEAEWKVGIVGPLMSFLLASLGYTIAILFLFFGWDATVPALMGQVNLTLGIFNLLPLLPLDGGRVLQGLSHQHLFITPKSRLRFARRSREFSFLWAWGFVFFQPWMTFLILYISKLRREELNGTIGFLEWQVEREMGRAHNDLAMLRLYSQQAWWKVLGLEEPPDSIAVLKAAYRRSTLANHPDRGGSSEVMRRVRSAYEIGKNRLGVH